MAGNPPTPLPVPLTLPALQPYVRAIVAERGFTVDLNEVFILMVEEVGELTGELASGGGRSTTEPPATLAYEVVDVLLYLVDLANGLGVDLARAWPGGETAHAPLNALAAPYRARRPDARAAVVALETVWEETGRLATHLRKHWKAMAVGEEVGGALVAAIQALLRIAGAAGIDLERAMMEKERLNAERTWHY